MSLSENKRKIDISYIFKYFSYSKCNDFANLLGGTFCNDARRYSEFYTVPCPQCMCPKEICGDRGKIGYFSELKKKYADDMEKEMEPEEILKLKNLLQKYSEDEKEVEAEN